MEKLNTPVDPAQIERLTSLADSLQSWAWVTLVCLFGLFICFFVLAALGPRIDK